MSKLELVGGLARSAARVGMRRLTGRRLRPGWSFGFETLVDAFRRSGREIRRLPPEAQGAAWEQRMMPHPVLRQVRFETASAGGVAAEWVVPTAGHDATAVLLYLHGGWYSSASPRNYRELLARVTTAAGVRALALDYRLAPAHPFPAALDDARAAWRWLMANGGSPSRTVVAGDSAGGGLSAALLVALRDAGEPLPAGAALLSPWVDLSDRGGSIVGNAPFDWIDPAELDERVRFYVGDGDAKPPLVSPGFAELGGLPPLLVQVGSAELLLDQGRRFAERARAAGVEVTLEVAPDMIHDWHLFAAFVPQARAAIASLAAFVRARLAA